ncbi:MAG: mono/diheme cytochrome c family protein [Limisphaerales bacterium]|jgi:mono/diheme cytochrome c family protein
MRSTLTFALAITLAGTGPSLGIEFNKDVRPVLSDNCFQCHGPDSGSRKAGLRLDREEDILADREGSRVVVPGKPAESELIKRITSTDPDEVMPPSGKEPLTPAKKKAIIEWIKNGASHELISSLKPI